MAIDRRPRRRRLEPYRGQLDELETVYLIGIDDPKNWLSAHSRRTPRGNALHLIIGLASSPGGLQPDHAGPSEERFLEHFGDFPENRFKAMLRNNDNYAREHWDTIVQELLDTGVLRKVEMCAHCQMQRFIPEHRTCTQCHV